MNYLNTFLEGGEATWYYEFMCYSAMVQQDVKALGIRFGGRVDLDMFEDLFVERRKGSGAKISKAMEDSFLANPILPQEKKIAKIIEEWRSSEMAKLEDDLVAQKKRLKVAEQKLSEKETKTALNEKRIASDKIARISGKLEFFKDSKQRSEERVFPFSYAPLIVMEKGEKIIRPFRYHLRPEHEGVEFDRKFDGTYNARRDSLNRVFWWKQIFGKNHGILVISKFYENVKENDFKHRKLAKGEEPKNLVLEFTPKGLSELLVPCIYDHNEEGEFPLNSFALITDSPNPEVAAVGHDRTPIIIKSSHINDWLDVRNKDQEDFEEILSDKQPTFFEHEVEE